MTKQEKEVTRARSNKILRKGPTQDPHSFTIWKLLEAQLVLQQIHSMSKAAYYCLPLSLSVSALLALCPEQWKKMLFLAFSVPADYDSVRDRVAVGSWHQDRLSILNKQQELVLWLFQARQWKWVSCVDKIGSV